MQLPSPLCLAAWAEQRQAEVVGAVHGEALLSCSLQNLLSVHQVHWRRNHSLKVASRDSSRRVQYPNSPYRDRLQLLPNDSLRISDLRRSDSSTYQVYLEDEMGQEYVESILLTVYGELAGGQRLAQVPEAVPKAVPEAVPEAVPSSCPLQIRCPSPRCEPK